ncbi:MAG: PQQ-binding-like beta-propeller repeat protein [Planctomycetes bacterium]|nr:PQQ-binding-like beta-propeller repeat protein [Planctomycetota bacterium]
MSNLTTHKHQVSSIRHWASCGENPTLVHFRHFSSLFTNLPSITLFLCAFCAFLWLKNPPARIRIPASRRQGPSRQGTIRQGSNQRNPRLMKYLRAYKAPVKPFNRLPLQVLGRGQTVNLRVLGNYANRLSSLICPQIMTYELRTTNYQLNKSDERSIFMQNEPNLPDDQMNVSTVIAREYENKSDWTLGENEPKTNPIKANFKRRNYTAGNCLEYSHRTCKNKESRNFTTTHGPGTSPVIYRDKIIFIQDQNRGESVFMALDKQTGRKLWQHDRREAMCWANPVIVRVADHDELIYNGSFHVKSYNPDTGVELWSLAGPTREAIPMIVTGGGLIYSASGRNGTIMAFRPGGKGDITRTHLCWLNERGGPHVPSPVYHQGRLYLVSDTGVTMCLEAASGDIVWQERLKGRFSMSPIIAGDKLILINEKGLAYILQAGDKLSILAQNDLREEILATPAVLGGRIYIRTASNLYCISQL